MFETILINLIVTVIAYLTVPVIFCLHGKKMTRKQIRKISIINGCCVCFAFIVLRAILEVKGSSGAFLLWMPVGYWMMSKKLQILDDAQKENNNDGSIDSTDKEQEKHNEKIVVEMSQNSAVKFEVAERRKICFCRKCGNKSVSNAAFCHKCGYKIDWF